MELAPVDFAAYSKVAVKQFFRTAVLIDDQIEVVNIELSGPTEEVIAPAFAATTMTAAVASRRRTPSKCRADCDLSGGVT